MLSNYDKKSIAYIMHNTNVNFEHYGRIKQIFLNNPVLKPRPETYSYSFKQKINYELEIIKELIILLKKKIINKDHVQFFKLFLQNSEIFEVHFGLFRNAVQFYGSLKQYEKIINDIDNMNILGSMLIGEVNMENNERTLDIKVKEIKYTADTFILQFINIFILYFNIFFGRKLGPKLFMTNKKGFLF